MVDEEAVLRLLRQANAEGQVSLLRSVLHSVKIFLGGEDGDGEGQGDSRPTGGAHGLNPPGPEGKAPASAAAKPPPRAEANASSSKDHTAEVQGAKKQRRGMGMDSLPGGPCDHCGTRESSAWRKGPPDKAELCNQCGSRYHFKGTLEGYVPKQRASKEQPSNFPKPQTDSKSRSPSMPDEFADPGKNKGQQAPDKAADKPAAAGAGNDATANQGYSGEEAGGHHAVSKDVQGEQPSSARAQENAEWMKIMEELEKKPQLAGSSRDLRELLISAMYASEKDPTARHMKISDKLQATLEMVTNRSVIQARRMALDVLEESRTNLMGCSKCGAARLTRHKIIDPHSFVCGHAECLYAERKCKTPPDDPKEWYYGPHPKVKAETGLMPKRKRMEEVAETSKRPWPGGAGKPGSGSSEDEQDVPQWPGLGGTRYSHDGRVIRPGMMPPGMPPMFGMPTGVLPPYGMENPQAAAAAAAAMFQTRGGWPIPPFPPYCPPFHSGYVDDRGRDWPDGSAMSSLEAAFASPGKEDRGGRGLANGSQDSRAVWPANKKISPRTHPSVPEDKSDSRGKSKGLGGPPYSRGNLVGDAEVPGGFDGRGVTARERNLERERGRERAPDGHWDGADSAFSPHNPESMRMAMLRGMFPPGIPPEAFAERGPPPGFPPGGPGWLPPGMMPPYEHLRASPGFPEYIKEGVSSRGGDPRALLGAGGLGPGGPTDPMAVAAAMHQHWAAQQGGKGQAPSPTALNNGKMKPSQSSKVNSPTDGREEARMDHRLREEGREGLQGVPAGPTVMWRAEVQPPESKDSHKMVLFKIKAHIPAWLKSKLPPALVVKGFTPRNSIDMSGIHIKPLVLELDELVDQQRLDLNMMIVDRVAIMCELPDLHLALVPHRNQYASLHILGMILPKRHAMAEFEQGFMANSY